MEYKTISLKAWRGRVLFRLRECVERPRIINCGSLEFRGSVNLDVSGDVFKKTREAERLRYSASRGAECRLVYVYVAN